MSFCQLGVGGVAPLHLAEPGKGVAQVGNVEVPLRIVVREVSQLLPVGYDFDRSEGRIRELTDVRSTPLRPLS
ncbi:MAG: hypothetical protein AAB254_08085, partial [candidate division NC10 bacterium]